MSSLRKSSARGYVVGFLVRRFERMCSAYYAIESKLLPERSRLLGLGDESCVWNSLRVSTIVMIDRGS